MTFVTFEQQRAAYDALGLSPEQWNHTASVLIEPGQVTVVRYLTSEDGKHYVINGEVATEKRTMLVIAGGPKPVADEVPE